MHAKFLVVCLSIAATNIMAAEANNPPSPSANASAQPAIAGASTSNKSIASRRIIAPTISETRATRMPDGSLALICHDRPNPKATALRQRALDARSNPDQQP
jgi:hypothetical protein